MSNEPTFTIDGNVATLCCGNKRCPTLMLEDDGLFLLADDNGNSVRGSRQDISRAVRRSLVILTTPQRNALDGAMDTLLIRS